MENRKKRESLSRLLHEHPNLSHLKKLTTPLGIVQHALGDKPDLRYGYSIDDSARALIVCIWYSELYGASEVKKLADIYLKHIVDAQLPSGKFHNFKDKNGKFLDSEGSYDSFGRAVWALGCASASTLVDSNIATTSLEKALPHIKQLEPIRTNAFALLGLSVSGHQEAASHIVEQLTDRFAAFSSPEWMWFENCLTYSNAILPYALFGANNTRARSIAFKSLDFLNDVSRVDGIPSPIGNRGWFCKDGKRATYDQQCIDAADMILANLAAHHFSGKKSYQQHAAEWLQWFYGNNLKHVTMVTPDGGVYDGIEDSSINTQQGAESVVVYLLAILAFQKSGLEPENTQ